MLDANHVKANMDCKLIPFLYMLLDLMPVHAGPTLAALMSTVAAWSLQVLRKACKACCASSNRRCCSTGSNRLIHCSRCCQGCQSRASQDSLVMQQCRHNQTRLTQVG